MFRSLPHIVLLATAILTAASGCAHWQRNDAACERVGHVGQKSSARCNSCGDACCDAAAEPMNCPCPILGACGRCSGCLAGRRCKLFTRPTPGPPPARYRPCMPPKFLPVPTQPILSPARPDAPEPWRGDVERSWRPELDFPAHD